MLSVLKDIFIQKKLIALFVCIALLIWGIAGVYQHGKTFVALWSVLLFFDWLTYVGSFSRLIIANTTTIGLVALILNCLGISLYITMKVYAYKQQARTRSVSGIIASILVFFGIGCASCGSLVVISTVSFFGFGSALALLPFGGSEIIFIALALLIFSNYILLKQLAKKVCPV